MKSLTGRMLMIAAAMTVVTAVASAQNMKAEIPFSFRVADKVMPAGTYMVGPSHGVSVMKLIQVTNLATGKSTLAMPQYEIGAGTNSAAVKLVFLCGNGPCALSQVWAGEGAQQLATPKRGQEMAKVIEVRLERAAD